MSAQILHYAAARKAIRFIQDDNELCPKSYHPSCKKASLFTASPP